jgi:hypothetical protein
MHLIILRRRQRGAVAIELALTLPIMLIFLTFPIFYASVCWHYTVAQKAAKDAARYLSTISVQEMRSKKLAPAAAAIASEIVRTEIAELSPGSVIDDPVIECGADPCKGTTSGPLPTTVRVAVKFDMYDRWFGVVDTGRYGWHIESNVTMRYVGN